VLIWIDIDALAVQYSADRFDREDLFFSRWLHVSMIPMKSKSLDLKAIDPIHMRHNSAHVIRGLSRICLSQHATGVPNFNTLFNLQKIVWLDRPGFQFCWRLVSQQLIKNNVGCFKITRYVNK